MKKVQYLAILALTALTMAQLDIPPDQPVCRLYGMIQVLGTIAGVLVAAYAGFILTSSNEITERNQSKMLLTGVVLGLIIIWLAPLVVKNLVGAGSICGW